jgi:hypothetical protein
MVDEVVLLPLLIGEEDVQFFLGPGEGDIEVVELSAR